MFFDVSRWSYCSFFVKQNLLKLILEWRGESFQALSFQFRYESNAVQVERWTQI